MSPTQLDLIQLGLEGDAWLAVRDLLKAHPDAAITSGRRTITEQGDAMAENVLLRGIGWLDVYVYAPIRDALKTWAQDNDWGTKAELAAGFVEVMRSFPEDELHHLSVHFSGRAFDVKPVSGLHGRQILRTLQALASKYGGKLLTKEGGLIRWHLQFLK